MVVGRAGKNPHLTLSIHCLVVKDVRDGIFVFRAPLRARNLLYELSDAALSLVFKSDWYPQLHHTAVVTCRWHIYEWLAFGIIFDCNFSSKTCHLPRVFGDQVAVVTWLFFWVLRKFHNPGGKHMAKGTHDLSGVFLLCAIQLPFPIGYDPRVTRWHFRPNLRNVWRFDDTAGHDLKYTDISISTGQSTTTVWNS